MGSPKFRSAIRDDKNAVTRVKQAIKGLEDANTHREDTREDAKSAYCARDRLEHVKKAIMIKHGDIVADHILAMRYGPVLASAYKWNGYHEEEIVCFISDLMPCLDREEIIYAIHHSGHFSNKEAADALGVTWDMREKHKLWMLSACDLTDQEFADQKAKKKNIQRMSRRRLNGVQPTDEVAVQNAVKVAMVKELETIFGRTKSTIYRYLTDGEIPPLPTDPSLIREYLTKVEVIAKTQAAVRPSRSVVGKSAANARSQKWEPHGSAYSKKEKASGATLFPLAQGGKPLKGAASLSVVSNIKLMALAAVAPRAAASPSQKKPPAVSDKGTKQNFNNPVNSILRITAKAAASAPNSIERVLQNAATACEQYVAAAKRRSANG